jgi:callose synthase
MACGLELVAEYAYGLTQRLDPKSEGRGVLQFKTGLKSIIKVVILFSQYLW